MLSDQVGIVGILLVMNTIYFGIPLYISKISSLLAVNPRNQLRPFYHLSKSSLHLFLHVIQIDFDCAIYRKNYMKIVSMPILINCNAENLQEYSGQVHRKSLYF